MFKTIKGHENCVGELYISPACFQTREVTASGLVCDTCNGLFINPEDDFLQKVAEARKYV